MTEVLEFAPPQLAHLQSPTLSSLPLLAPSEDMPEVDLKTDALTELGDGDTSPTESENAPGQEVIMAKQVPPTMETDTVEKEPVKLNNPVNAQTPFTEKLERNSVIPVTVDDQNEGIIMVSFLHNNTTYQGVLLQLNRERGIPCGISFPKDFCPGINSSNASDTDPNDPNQVSPINQRNTYFQQTDGDGGGAGAKSRLALRRVIKPPARYKNGRNHLKLRQRPVLCIKCRTLCEEKNAAANNSNENSNECADKKSSTSLIVGGVTTRRGYAKFINSGNLNENENSNDTTNPDPPKEDDFSFKSIGSKGIVDNFWKRPMNEDKVETTAAATHNLTNLTVNLPKLNISKTVNTMPELKPMTSSATSATGIAASTILTTSASTKNPILLKSLTAPLKTSPQIVPNGSGTSNISGNQAKQSKSKSLGDCINNITERKKKDIEKQAAKPEANRRKIRKSRLIRNVTQSSASDTESTGSSGSATRSTSATAGPAPKALVQLKEETENFSSSSSSRRKSSSKGDDKNGSRKRSSTLPERYRDETYLTKNNVFGFKKRRIDENQEDENENTDTSKVELADVQFNDELPMSLVGCLEKRHPTNLHQPTTATSKLPTAASSKTQPMKETAKKQTDLKVSVKERSLSGSSISPNSGSSAAISGATTSKINSVSIPSTTTAGTSSSTSINSNNNGEQLQHEVHSNKTPVIKITFGSSGNGVVVQIPPKETQNSSISAPSIIPSRPDDLVAATSKAVRKAMKRAKKAAKKNRSISFESALPCSSRNGSNKPTSSAKLFDNRSSTSAYAVTSTSVPTSSSRLQHSPSPPVLNPEYPFLSPDYNSSSESSNVTSEHSHHHLLPKNIDFPTPSVYVAKKKKKDKRKKKSKASTKQVAKASSSTSLPKLEPSDNSCTSSSGSHLNILSLCDDTKLRRLYHPEEGPFTTDDDTDVDSSAPVLKNELLESLKYESENSTTSASTENDHQERLCISLKRLSSNSNAYVTCSKSTMSETNNRSAPGSSTSAAADSSDNAVAGPSSGMHNSTHTYRLDLKKMHESMNSTKHLSADAGENTSSDASTNEMNNNNYSTASEASDNEFPMNNVGSPVSPAYDENFGGCANSIDSYSVDNPPCTFRKGDIIWGKLSGCPWWPAKILDILYITEDDIRAKVCWYNASTQSFIGFTMMVPFATHFEAKFNRARRRGTYKKAVRQALIEAHRMNPEDLPSD